MFANGLLNSLRGVLGVRPAKPTPVLPSVTELQVQGQVAAKLADALKYGSTITIGRSRECDVVVPNGRDNISRIHCSIKPSEDGKSFIITDGTPDGKNPSMNGVWIALSGGGPEKVVDGPRRVPSGSTVQLGDSFRFILPQLGTSGTQPAELAAHGISPETHKRGFDNTIKMARRLKSKIERGPQGSLLYTGEPGLRIPVITRNSKIIHGVSLGQGSSREAINVNILADRPLNDFVNALILETNRLRYSLNTPIQSILRLVSVRVADAFGKFDNVAQRVDALNEGHQLTQDKLVNLGFYLENGLGVCRHRALTAAVILQALVNDGKINAEVTVDRNNIKGRGAHAWCRVKDLQTNKVYIVDPMLGFVGSTDQVTSSHWPYLRARDLR
jgi:hypothetical protein